MNGRSEDHKAESREGKEAEEKRSMAVLRCTAYPPNREWLRQKSFDVVLTRGPDGDECTGFQSRRNETGDWPRRRITAAAGTQKKNRKKKGFHERYMSDTWPIGRHTWRLTFLSWLDARWDCAIASGSCS